MPFMTIAAKAPIVTLSDEEVGELDRWWRAANDLSVGQIYLMDNPLLARAVGAPSMSSRVCWVIGGRRRG